MKVPNIFKPERDLEYKTESLLNEEPKPKVEEYKPAVESSELEKVLNIFDPVFQQQYPNFSREYLHGKIDEMIEKSDYKRVPLKKLKYKYWSRPSPYTSDERFVFIKDFNVNWDIHYSFATVKNHNLEEFCKRFEKERTIINGHRTIYSPLAKGAITGGILGFIADYTALELIGINTSYTAPGVTILGMILGFLYGVLSIKYVHNKNKEKLGKCADILVTSHNKNVIQLAFS